MKEWINKVRKEEAYKLFKSIPSFYKFEEIKTQTGSDLLQNDSFSL